MELTEQRLKKVGKNGFRVVFVTSTYRNDGELRFQRLESDSKTYKIFHYFVFHWANIIDWFSI